MQQKEHMSSKTTAPILLGTITVRFSTGLLGLITWSSLFFAERLSVVVRGTQKRYGTFGSRQSSLGSVVTLISLLIYVLLAQ